VWTDAHCHITDEHVEPARAAGVGRLITVGTDLASSRLAIDVASRHDGVWATAGVHPHDAKDGIAGIEALLADPNVVAVGECGLDHHYDHSPRDVQREAFAAQIALAHGHGLALVIHTREAWPETFDILRAEGVPERTVFHCFTGGPDEARTALDLGAALSFSGIVSFPSAEDLREAARVCPLDRMTVETDTPYLAPVPHRGKKNQPAWVPLVGAAVAEAKGVAVEEVEAATTATAAALFAVG
jgi:TatD DNase family protein